MGYYQSGDSYYQYGDPGFFDWLGGAAKSVGGAMLGVARTVAPIAMPLIGTALGGPIGGMIGGGLSALISGGGGGSPDPIPTMSGGSALGAIGAFMPTMRAYQQLPTMTEPPRSVGSTHGPAAEVDVDEYEEFQEAEEEYEPEEFVPARARPEAQQSIQATIDRPMQPAIPAPSVVPLTLEQRRMKF